MEHFLSKFPDGRLARDPEGNSIPRPVMYPNKTLWAWLDEQHDYNIRWAPRRPAGPKGSRAGPRRAGSRERHDDAGFGVG